MQTHTVQNARILMVDDNVDLLKLMSIRLKPLKFDLKTVTSAEQALSTLSIWPADLVITDLQMPGMSGMELFEQIQQQNPLLPVIILTAHGTIPEAVEATQSGVTSYLTKPFDSAVLIEQIRIALVTSGLEPADSQTLVNEEPWRNRIPSKSPLIKKLLAEIESLANDDNALIGFEGEPGTGKDELARVAHECSQRANGNFVHLNCTSIPDDLIMTELFGCVGDEANNRFEKEGLLREANDGTLLLSDFNEAPKPLLQKLYTSLIKRSATPVNSDNEYPIDIKVIVTTSVLDGYDQFNEELNELTNKLALTMLSVPALRDRREDIPLMINQCLMRNSDQNANVQFSNKATHLILAADWPGNIRQLISVVQQCVRLSKTKIISDALVSSRIKSPMFRIQPLTNAHRDFERNYLTEVLKVTNGNVTKAANMAKRNRTEFHRLLKKHKMEAKSFRQ